MKQLIVTFFLIIFFLPTAFAETKIFSGKAITDAEKAIDGTAFKFKYDENSNKVFADTPAGSLIIDNGACKSNPIFRICINSANFSYKNITTYVYYYEIGMDIYKLTGSLSTASKMAPNTLLQGEQAEFSITITNPTDFEITGIAYKEDLAPFFIKELRGCELDGKNIIWQGSLKSKYDKICAAAVIAEKEGAYSLAGNLSYFNGFENEKKNTDSLAVAILPKQLKASQFMDKDIELKQPFYINMSLQNIHKDEKLELTAAIHLPDSLALLKEVTGFNRELNVLRRSIILEHGAMLNYSLHLASASQIGSTLRQEFIYTIKGLTDKIENATFVKAIEPKPIINFSAEYGELSPGQKFIVVVKLKNPGRSYELNNIKAVLNAPYNNEIRSEINKLMPNESYAIISNTLVAPEDDALKSGNKTFNISLLVHYAFDGALQSLSETFELKLKKEEKDNAIKNDTIIAINAAENATKEAIQESGSAKKEETASVPSNISNEAGESAKTIDKTIEGTVQYTIEDKPNPLFDKGGLLISALIFVTLLAILSIFIVIRKKGKGRAKDIVKDSQQQNEPKTI